MGSGPLSRGEEHSADGTLKVEYPAFARTDSPYRIVVHTTAARKVGDQVELWIESALLEALEVESIAPEPAETTLGTGRLHYRFRAAAADDPAPIVLHVKTDAVGRHAGRIGLQDGPSVNLALWIYP